MNTRKPTKREAKQAHDGMVWHGMATWFSLGDEWKWVKREVSKCRDLWQRGDRWLPYDAIPDPTNQPTTKGRKA